MTNEAQEMTSSSVRANLAEVLNAAAVRGVTTYITTNGRRTAAVVPVHIAEAAERVRKHESR